MKTLSAFILCLLFTFSFSEVSAKCHKHKYIKHEIQRSKAGLSKESGRPKPITDSENKKNQPKKDRTSERKRDKYGAYISAPKGKWVSPDYAYCDKPKIVKQPKPIDWDDEG